MTKYPTQHGRAPGQSFPARSVTSAEAEKRFIASSTEKDKPGVPAALGLDLGTDLLSLG